MNVLLECNNLTFSYSENEQLLNDITFKLEYGKIYALTGANGSGKSTLLRIISKLLSADGEIILCNDSNLNDQEYHKKVSFVPTDPLLYDSLTSLENLKLIGNLWLIKDMSRYIELCKLLMKELNIMNSLHTSVENLSLGMKNKLFFIANIARKPDLLLLDEPFSSWDKDSVDKIFLIINEFISENNSTILFVSHSDKIINNLSDFQYKLVDGNLI